jgi:hypothetical protein
MEDSSAAQLTIRAIDGSGDLGGSRAATFNVLRVISLHTMCSRLLCAIA